MATTRPRHNPWVVLVTAYIVIATGVSYVYIMGILFPYIMDLFNTNRAETAVLQSTVMGVFPLGGILYGSFISRMGPKVVCITGTCLASIGLGISFFATSLVYLIISFGILAAIGIAMLFMSSSVVVGQCFEGRKGFVALSILSTAVGVGAMGYNFILVFLLDTYGLSGSLLVVSAMSMHGLPMALMWPSHPRKEAQQQTSIASESSAPTSDSTHENNNSEHIKRLQDSPIANGFTRNISALSFSDEDIIKTQFSKDRHTRRLTVSALKMFDDSNLEQQNSKLSNTYTKRGIIQRFTSILRNVNFILFLIANTIATPLSMLILIIIVDWSVDKGFTRSDGSFALLIVNIFSIIGRIVPGFILLIPKMTTLSVPIIAFLLGSVAYIGMMFVNSFSSLLITCAMIGVSSGMLVTCFTVTVLRLTGKESLSDAMGIVMTMFGAMNACIGPITGYVRDLTGSYTSPFLTGAIGMFLGMCITGVNQYLRVKQRTGQKRSRSTSIFYITKM